MILVTTALNDISVYKILLSSDTDNLKMTKYWLINRPVLVCQDTVIARMANYQQINLSCRYISRSLVS